MALCFAFVLLAAVPPAPAAPKGELTTTLADQTGVAVTIYNNNLALVKDRRRLKLPAGRVDLAYREVSARIRPESAILQGEGVTVLEQNFVFDLLTPEALLRKFVGRKVEVIGTHPTTGAEKRRSARLLSANDGVVLRFADGHIETGIPGRLSFPEVPENLRDRPTLTMQLDNAQAGVRELELSYLTTGLKWQADYVACLAAGDQILDLSGWVTLTNTSGVTYRRARLQLVAGDVNRVRQDFSVDRNVRLMKAGGMPAPAPEMAQEAMFEYHLYTLGRPTTIADKQSKQVALLQAAGVKCRKEFLVNGNSGYFTRAQRGGVADKLKVGVYVAFENRKADNLGLPLPKGVVRVYKEDSHGALQFVGEDRIDHTPENEEVRLKLGEAFDLTATRKQTSFKKLGGDGRYNYTYESAYEIKLKNAKKEDVTIKVREPLPGDWEILSETLPHQQENSRQVSWQVPVPAGGKTVLTYRVRVRF
jgi:hypothetical protein